MKLRYIIPVVLLVMGLGLVAQGQRTHNNPDTNVQLGTSSIITGAETILSTELDIVGDGTITLGGETTGSYVATVADGTGIDGTATGEGSTYTPSFDATELTALTWSDGASATTAWTFNLSTDDPVLSATAGGFDMVSGGATRVTQTLTGFAGQSADFLFVQNSGFVELASITSVGLLQTAVGLDAVGAVDMDYGSEDVTDHTFLTDGTGDGEFVVPTQSISTSEITNNTITANDLHPDLAFSDGDVIDFSASNSSDATDGIILPQIASACVAAIAQGQICWDTAGEDLYIGNGAAAVQMNVGSTPALNDVTDVTLTTPGDGAVLCFTGTSNNSVDCTVGGDATATEDAGTLTVVVVDDSHDHVITNIDTFTKAALATQTSDVVEYAEADGEVWTGAHDFGGATSLEIVNGAAPTVDAAGEIAWDTTATPSVDGEGSLVVHDGGSGSFSLPIVQQACVMVENLAAADDNLPLWSPMFAVDLKAAWCECTGTCTTEADVSFEKDSGGTITALGVSVTCEDTTTGDALTDMTGTTAIGALDVLRIDVDNAVSPETDEYSLCWTYTIDRT